LRLVGYADRLSVAPGETIAFMVSAQVPTYRADLVQLVHGDTNPAGPGFKARAVVSTLSGQYAGIHQRLCPGSYVSIPLRARVAFPDGISVHMWIRATTPDKPLQTLISSGSADTGFAVRLDKGRLALRLGRAVSLLERPLTD